jgi:hypothetical protein
MLQRTLYYCVWFVFRMSLNQILDWEGVSNMDVEGGSSSYDSLYSYIHAYVPIYAQYGIIGAISMPVSQILYYPNHKKNNFSF